MKNLVISLHRLGDLIMHGHVIQQLAQTPNRSVDLFTHSFFSQVSFLFPFIKNSYIFEREKCQRAIGEKIYCTTWPLQHISAILNQLNSASYNLSIDLSQTDTSSRWHSFISSEQKIGICYNQMRTKQQLCSSNSAMAYLHSHSTSQYHFNDLFKLSLNLPLSTLPKSSPLADRDKLIAFQVTTSDPKKTLPLSKWIHLFNSALQEFPDFELIVLASPNEYQYLKDKITIENKRLKVVACSMFEAHALLSRAALLVSLDTSIKHLATWTETPIIEISLGSSNPIETGPYQTDAFVLKPKNPSCYPCRHALSCSIQFACHNEVAPDDILAAMRLKMTREASRIPTNLTRVSQNSKGFLFLEAFQKGETPNAGRHQESTEIDIKAYRQADQRE